MSVQEVMNTVGSHSDHQARLRLEGCSDWRGVQTGGVFRH